MTAELKFCVECRWHCEGNCRHPSNYKETIDLVTGDRRMKYVSQHCSVQRVGPGRMGLGFDCGESGHFWEPIPDDQLNGAEHVGTTEPSRKTDGEFLKGI